MVSGLLWYAFFGLVHELYHLLAAYYLLGNVFEWPAAHELVTQAVFGRFIQVSNDEDIHHQLWIIRHAGWILSVLTALMVSTKAAVRVGCSKSLKHAAMLTAFDAVASDLFSWCPRTMGMGVLFCGNFGVLALNPAWNDSDAVFDLLGRMIQITMMRGAQSGGVIMWDHSTVERKNSNPQQQQQPHNHHATVQSARKIKSSKPISVRVIKAKRQDLSKLLSSRVKSRGTNAWGQKKKSIRCFLGHTRFATSSKATLEGTHPHQWSPPEQRRVYPLDDDALWSTVPISSPSKTSANLQPISRKVSNYITHNGDFDFFRIHGRLTSISKLQKWLAVATNHPVPAQVDSACIAGLIDILRTAGCWGLSLRFAMLLGVPGVTFLNPDSTSRMASPSYQGYQEVGRYFELALSDYCSKRQISLANIRENPNLRKELCQTINNEFHHQATFQTLRLDSGEIEEQHFSLIVDATVEAFFRNDLFFATKFFMANAVGSFGIMVTCSEDASRQICLAARGQPMSVAFYPKKGLVLYGSELAAVKAGLSFEMPGGDLNLEDVTEVTEENITQATCRLSLDDLSGEVVLLDWGPSSRKEIIKPPDEGVASEVAQSAQKSMLSVTVHRESGMERDRLHLRDSGTLTMLEGNDLLLPLPSDDGDVIQNDIYEIPTALERVQYDWKKDGTNRRTAVTLSNAIKGRLLGRMDGSIPLSPGTVDILVTGCEVSLWLSEQFASDLQKALPNLCIRAMSSNKILGILGQELAVPARGFPISTVVSDFHDTIVMIVSQSGGTFAPSAISNLLQSVTQNLFLVTSEWDTQVGKRLLDMSHDGQHFGHRGRSQSRIFTTNIGLRTAEPCTISVAATHEMLTQIFLYICASILESPELTAAARATVTQKDLAILTSCGKASIEDLGAIVGERGTTESRTERNLRGSGKLWSRHVLENCKAMILSFVYVVVTVTTGFPVITALHHAVNGSDEILYVVRFLDSLIFFFIPQIFILLIRVVEGRDLRHRMGTRTIVVADVPWVAQAVEAFISKLFACAYSMATVNVISGNPEDHLVHRHTHRVVRGTLLACGRPDGRLSSLTSAESAVNLAASQACSIVSVLGGSCEMVTIGHNPAALGLSKQDIFLPTNRAPFLGERIRNGNFKMRQTALLNRQKFNYQVGFGRRAKTKRNSFLEHIHEPRNLWSDTNSIKAFYLDVHARGRRRSSTVAVADAIQQMGWDKLNQSSNLDLEVSIGPLSNEPVGDESLPTLTTESAPTKSAVARRKGGSIVYRDAEGLLQIRGTSNDYFGQDSKFTAPGSTSSLAFDLIEEQSFVIELYENRIASLERFVAMCVMFYEMGQATQDFVSKMSLGLLGYRMDRTHSILRVATTASPVSGDAVQERMKVLRRQMRDRRAASTIQVAWRRHKKKQIKTLLRIASERNAKLHSD
eukprot:CAMPEP_0168768872 /NCGR_PEP_ID=MMETSP0725-20121227/2106_1 /TAXON_ID=265536 /ORGANISM="Amphiprora sp., Strain CCMP467" /LENGTH=1423 /DNA_ID=CAMNT_0008818255 /DNA_START=10 /DNA_END=4281 /DNA_ORIENTATION=-